MGLHHDCPACLPLVASIVCLCRLVIVDCEWSKHLFFGMAHSVMLELPICLDSVWINLYGFVMQEDPKVIVTRWQELLNATGRSILFSNCHNGCMMQKGRPTWESWCGGSFD